MCDLFVVIFFWFFADPPTVSSFSLMKITKIVVAGASGSGKTSLIRRHVHGLFLANSPSSSSVDFSLVCLSDDQQVHLWDVPGTESSTGR